MRYLSNIDNQLNFIKLQESNSRVWFKNKCEFVAEVLGFCKKVGQTWMSFMSHCLGLSYYVNFLGGLGSNESYMK